MIIAEKLENFNMFFGDVRLTLATKIPKPNSYHENKTQR